MAEALMQEFYSLLECSLTFITADPRVSVVRLASRDKVRYDPFAHQQHQVLGKEAIV